MGYDTIEKYCLHCHKPLENRIRQRKFCSTKCKLEYDVEDPRIFEIRKNILEALVDRNGIRWLPDCHSLYAMSEQRNVPLLEVITTKSPGVLGKTKDSLVRLTLAGWKLAEYWGIYEEKEIV